MHRCGSAYRINMRASWTDALPVLRQRVPALAEQLTAILSTAAASGTTCLHEAAACGTHLDAQGWTARPPWDILLSGPRAPPPLDEAEPGLFRHGWQQPAALVLHTAHRAREVMPTLPEAEQALLRSQSGPHAAAWLTLLVLSWEQKSKVLTCWCSAFMLYLHK